jgi:hypothetical protein
MAVFRVQQALAGRGDERPLDDRLASRLGSREAVGAFKRHLHEREASAAREVARRIGELGEDWSGEQTIVVLYGGPLESEGLRRDLLAELEDELEIDPASCLHASASFCAGYGLRRDQAVALGAATFGRFGHPLPQYDYRVRQQGTDDIWPLSMDPSSTRRIGFAPRMTPPIDVGIEVQIGYAAGLAPFKAHDSKVFSVPVRNPQGRVGVAYDRAPNGVSLQIREVDRAFRPFAASDPISITIPEVSTRFRVNGSWT